MPKQKLVPWEPVLQISRKTLFVEDISICSPEHQKLSVNLRFQEGDLSLHFNDTRAFWTSWDGDPNPFMTFDESSQRPSWLVKVEESRWLASEYFSLDLESSCQVSETPWEHFYILANDRSIHIAARDDLEANWTTKH